MSCTAKELVDVAKKEIGVTELPSGSNKVKYNTWYYGRVVRGAAYPWCAVFVSWCTKQAGGYSYLNGLSNKAYCPSFVTWAKKKGYWLGRTTNPKPGDLVIFANRGLACHIGIVEEKVTNAKVKTIEGNTSVTSNDNGGAVMRRTRKYNKTNSSWYILGFIRLPFESEQKDNTETPATEEKDIRIVTAKSGLNVRKSASTSAKIITCYSYNKTIAILEISKNGKWGRTDDGWVYLYYTKKK